jgi:hypothetical protein
VTQEVKGKWKKLHKIKKFVMCNTRQTLLGDQIKQGEMGGTYSTYGGDENCVKNFGWES